MAKDGNQLAARVAAINKVYEDEKNFFGVTRRHFPSRSACIGLVQDIRKLLFPGYFDNESAAGESTDYLTSERILHIERVLQEQVKNALIFGDGTLDPEVADRKAAGIAGQFLDQLPDVLELLLTDIQALYDGDPAAGSLEEVLVSYPGMYAIFVYRIAHVLYQLNVPLIPRLMSEHAHSKTGIDINPGANIGRYFFIDHGTGVVIGETTDIGDHVKLYQGVTLGALSTRKGQALSGVKRHPTLGNYVTVYSNASILGGETVIGDGAVISGSAFVCESVPKNARVKLNQETVIHRPDEPEPKWFYVI
ncbi:MAG: serine O-acetyltransferase [Coriobacteriales bacterium]|nr:serine O-acetyltransferase [Coriobacteriales bacterium]